MTFTCRDARLLVSSYADGELSEAQAGLLRKHLLECSACRLSVQDEKALKRWFVAADAPAVPADFAARVARRAFAGDRGAGDTGAGDLEPAAARPGSSAAASFERPLENGRLFDFVLRMTAVAAAAAIVLVVAIRREQLPEGPMQAGERQRTLSELREELDLLNRPLLPPGESAPAGRSRPELEPALDPRAGRTALPSTSDSRED